jgi:hypothetical protein
MEFQGITLPRVSREGILFRLFRAQHLLSSHIQGRRATRLSLAVIFRAFGAVTREDSKASLFVDQSWANES